MKRMSLFILILIFVAAGSAFAGDKNIEAENILVGGAADLGFALGTRTATPEEGDDIETNTTSFGLSGYMGYFVIDGFELGPILALDNEKITYVEGGANGDDAVSSTTTYDFGLQLGYFFDLGGAAVPYGMLGIAYRGGSTSYDNGDTEATADMSGYVIEPKVGANIFFTEAIALDLGLFVEYASYTQTQDSGEDDSEEADFDVSETNYGLAVGFNVFF